jgi:integrase
LSRYKQTIPDQGERPLALYRSESPDLRGLVARWVTTTPHLSPTTLYLRSFIAQMDDLTPEAAARWVTAAVANNSIRGRLSVAREFSRWLNREGIICTDLTADWEADVRKSHPRVYGKTQAKYPARFLTYDEAFRQLIPACQDGTWVGSRDQLAIRLGLLGLRRGELVALTWGNLHPDGLIRVKGKGNRIREVAPGSTLATLLTRWRRQYEKALGRPLTDTDPMLCCMQYRRLHTGRVHPAPAVAWGKPLTPELLHDLVTRRGKASGLGHVTPHDLRRSAASILHRDIAPDGGHRFDLLDIQRVLDHADPTTTQRSYIDRLDTAVKVRAGATLD